MSDCIFCKIVSGQIPAATIYQDEDVLAFLDINPVNKGHALVIPKSHHKMMVDTPDETIEKIFVQSKKLMKVIKKTLAADFVAISVVGIDVPHFHVHLVPRFANDGLANWWPTKTYEEGEMEQFKDKIIKNL